MNDPDSDLIDLCGKLRDETITAEEFAHLERRLEDSPEDRAFYLQFQQLDSLLEKFPPETAEGKSVTPFPLRSAILTGLAAAAAIALTLFYATRPEANPIATLVLAEDCDWRGEPHFEGQRLVPGRLAITTGTAVIRFDSGAETILTDRAALTLIGPAHARLEGGQVVVRAEDEAEGFILDTEASRFIDLGTEFTVALDESGAAELHVHEGEVETSGEVFAAGHAVRIDRRGQTREEIAAAAPRFAELLARAEPKERRDLMTAYEGFLYDPDTYTPDQLTGGSGWVGPWRLRRGTEEKGFSKNETASMVIANNAMDVAWPIKGGRSSMLEMPPGPMVRIREMKKPIRMGRYGVRYFSFLVTEPDTISERREDGKWERLDLRLTFRASDDYFGEALSFGWSRKKIPGIGLGDHSRFNASQRIPTGETVFCVGKMITRKSGDDEISFRVYTASDPLDIVEPPSWDVTTRQQLDASFDLVLLTSQSKRERYFDEIRIGPTWRSVTPVHLPLFTSLETP